MKLGDSERFAGFFANIQGFLVDTLSRVEVDDGDYVAGSTRIEFYASYLRRDRRLRVEEHVPAPTTASRRHEFEEALFARLLQSSRLSPLVLLGGLGAGKTTTMQFLLRRFAERIGDMRASYSQDCVPCFREPLYLDFIAERTPNRAGKKVICAQVFSQLRIAIHKRVIAEWLAACGVERELVERVDRDFMVLRRLVISNDLLRFAGDDQPGIAELAEPNLRLKGKLMEMRPSASEVLQCIDEYRTPAEDYLESLRAVASDPYRSTQFMVHTLQFYASRCAQRNPLNLIILDNLDALPTPVIEHVLNRVHDVATRASGMPIIVPLRPSSVNPYGFVREMSLRYHYGPNSFEMILSRLERYVLMRPREDLRAVSGREGLHVFEREPMEAEVSALLVVAYVYARIMAAGLSRPGRRQRQVGVHREHEHLRRMDIGTGALLSAAETVDALVGTSCRYAFDLIKRFFWNAYSRPAIMARASSIDGGGADPAWPFDYAETVQCILGDPREGPQLKRVANLFRPTRRARNRDWPTTSKLRVLAMLNRDKRLTVHSIVERLALYGIPVEVAVEALNSLQDKFRLLLWLSTNKKLKLGKLIRKGGREPGEVPKSLAQEVVISEHGESYFRRVVGDFEYVWHCASELEERSSLDEGMNFTVKLGDYAQLIERLGTTELKQICFERFRKGALADLGGIGRASRMIVLDMLYSSLARAILSAGIASRVSEERELVREIRGFMEQVCKSILFWQRVYQLAHGSNYYLDVYEEQLGQLKIELLDVRDGELVDRRLARLIDEVHASWNEELRETRSWTLESIATTSGEDPRELVEKYGRAVVPGIEEWAGVVADRSSCTVYAGRFLKTRSRLGELLSARIPTQTQLYGVVSQMLRDAGEIVTRCEVDASESRVGVAWFIEERASLEEARKLLSANEYDVPKVCGSDEMSSIKERFNNTMEVAERLARRTNPAKEMWHLSLRWQ